MIGSRIGTPIGTPISGANRVGTNPPTRPVPIPSSIQVSCGIFNSNSKNVKAVEGEPTTPATVGFGFGAIQ